MMRKLCLLVLLGLSAFPAVAQDSRWASAIIRISFDSELMPLDADLITRIARSDPILGEVIAEVVVGLPADEAASVPDMLSLEFEPLGTAGGGPNLGRVLVGELSIGDDSDRGRAKELLAGVLARLERALREAIERDRIALERSVGATRQRFTELQARMSNLHHERAAMLKHAGAGSLDRNQLASEQHRLRRQIADLDMEQAALNARQAELARQIEIEAGRSEASQAGDEISRQLQQVLELREQHAAAVEMQVESGLAGPQDQQHALEQIADARMRLMSRREQVVAGAREMLSELNGELRGVTMERVELEARRQILAEQLARFEQNEVLALADAYANEVELPLELLEREVHNLKGQLLDLEAAVNKIQLPRFEVLGAPSKD